MEALGLVLVAALFGYFATIVVRRHEVLRSIALEVDAELREALNEAVRDRPEQYSQSLAVADHAQTVTMLEETLSRLIRAELHAASLPQRDRERVVSQIGVAQHVASWLHAYARDPDVAHQAHVVPAIIAAREVVAPLLLPPPFLYRRPAEPRSYPGPERFFELTSTRPRLEALQEALGQDDRSVERWPLKRGG